MSYLGSLGLTSLIATSIVSLILYSIRKYIAEYITHDIQHKYDKKFEEFQSIIRKDEEERNFIRNAVLNTISSTDNVVKSRQIAAFDELWLSLIEKKKFTGLMSAFSLLNVEVLKKWPEDKKIKFLEPFKIDMKSLANETHKAERVRPWISPMGWALYLAYDSIMYYFVSQIHILTLGYDPNEFLSKESVLELVNSAIPESNIESIENSLLVKYFEILELKLIVELKNQIKNLPLNTEADEHADGSLNWFQVLILESTL